MSVIDNIVVVDIIKGTQGVSRPGFGIPFLLSYHGNFAEKYKQYNSLAEVGADFNTSSVEYARAQVLFDSTTKDNNGKRMLVPEKIFIGRLPTNVRISVLSSTDGTYKFSINNTEFSFVASSDSKADIASGIVALINASAEPVTAVYTATNEYFDLYADVSGVDFSVLIDEATQFSVGLSRQLSTLTFASDLITDNAVNLNVVHNDVEWAMPAVTFTTDMETTAGLIATALETNPYISSATVSATPFRTITIETINNREISITDIVVTLGTTQTTGTFAETKSFKNGDCKTFLNALTFQDYYFVLYARDFYDNAEVADLSDFLENWEYKKAFWFNTNDSRIGTETALNVIAQIKAKAIARGKLVSSIERTVAVYTKQLDNYVADGLIGANGDKTAGGITWAYKKAKLCIYDDYTNQASILSFLRSNNANYYTRVAGLDMSSPSDKGGITIGGEYFDITHGSDWLKANLELDVVETMALNDKIPFTNKGVSILVNKVYSRMQEAQAVGFLSDEEDILVTAVDIDDLTSAQRQSRIFEKITASGRFAGAIQKTYIEVNLTF